MRNKIFTILGVLIVVVAVGAYFLFDANVRQNSQTTGLNVLIANQNIPDGTVIKDLAQAKQLFGVRRITQSQAVPSAVTVAMVAPANEGLMDKIKGFFVSQGGEVSNTDLANLVNHKVTENIFKNEQVISAYLSSDTSEFKTGERYFAIPTSYEDSVGAEIFKGDYVDLWIHYGDKAAKPGSSAPVMQQLQVVKIKDSNNVEITSAKPGIPKLVIFKLNEDQIKAVSEAMTQGSLFLTKYGVNPMSQAVFNQVKNQAPVSSGSLNTTPVDTKAPTTANTPAANTAVPQTK